MFVVEQTNRFTLMSHFVHYRSGSIHSADLCCWISVDYSCSRDGLHLQEM